jgi:hypothetical protein
MHAFCLVGGGVKVVGGVVVAWSLGGVSSEWKGMKEER